MPKIHKLFKFVYVTTDICTYTGSNSILDCMLLYILVHTCLYPYPHLPSPDITSVHLALKWFQSAIYHLTDNTYTLILFIRQQQPNQCRTCELTISACDYNSTSGSFLLTEQAWSSWIKSLILSTNPAQHLKILILLSTYFLYTFRICSCGSVNNLTQQWMYMLQPVLD